MTFVNLIKQHFIYLKNTQNMLNVESVISDYFMQKCAHFEQRHVSRKFEWGKQKAGK